MAARSCCDSRAEPEKCATGAEDWLLNVEDRTHRLLAQWPFDRSINTRPRSVRIAVLDTGIDTTHNAFRDIMDFRGPIRAYKCWDREGRLDETTVDDTDGHGTHVAAILLRLAPRALLYVARIAERRDLITATNVAKVTPGAHCV